MASYPNIPDIVIGRLPIYLRALNQLMQQGKTVTSSHELGQRLGISSAQIRKDLSHFGEFGKQGTGYQISHLQAQLKQILQVDREWQMIIVGAGDLGRALAHYRGFVSRGFRVVAAFDNDPARLGKSNDVEVLHTDQMQAFIKQHNIKIAMIAVPAESAQAVCDQLVEAGVRAILNYAPITLSVPSNVHVQYIDPVMHLQRMTYYLE
ncbi:MAG: redox-sensing transcriptional repressor Rex [Candidatus Thermofonsia Clade 1 bacterium]|jgi:redox-sensing transcriptional repressor|uniref:Redox-sensing transcriptional repressor Rex n=1 Tax=Candidatus Thermofonsia Clade 1 bacterium TaxID=2364210 RepID=A0A2M8Q074_9CHLR|nr:MAG: redox-sensing transcriptional repressor Rex [Candidatus Thermofonsia Clade 1 bacterium]PJF43206.1 MAG: redox-sensing transcriptional repressor Rex [Candidatus Thermofonsia Clade 1 bacterium]RMF50870.1 MAG: redox-sensing transcriptional repressor Rex [Chloroflexota bacterium]